MLIISPLFVPIFSKVPSLLHINDVNPASVSFKMQELRPVSESIKNTCRLSEEIEAKAKPKPATAAVDQAIHFWEVGKLIVRLSSRLLPSNWSNS